MRERARLAAADTANPPDPCAEDQPRDANWMGAMRDAGEIVGDIVSPAADLSDWDALHPEPVQQNDDDGA